MMVHRLPCKRPQPGRQNPAARPRRGTRLCVLDDSGTLRDVDTYYARQRSSNNSMGQGLYHQGIF
jgi:hypothetical protein